MIILYYNSDRKPGKYLFENQLINELTIIFLIFILMINSPIKYGPKEPLGRSVTKSPTPAPNKHMLLAMNELMKKMGFFNITKLKEVHSKHHHDDAELEI